MATQQRVEVDVRVNVHDEGLQALKNKLKGLGNDFKGMGGVGESSFKGINDASKAWLNDFAPLLQLSENELRAMGGAGESSFKKLNSTGTSTLNNLGNAIRSKMVQPWNAVKSKVTSVSSSIKTQLGSSITSAVNKLKTGTTTAGKSMVFLRNAASMTVGMIGYDLVMGMTNSARESINAAGNFQKFGERLGMSAKEITAFSDKCDQLQNTFKKVDMRAVGASAAELGVKLKVPKNQVGDLTKLTAVMSSAFVKEGRTQEDAILAVSDAMDGQFRRLQELGITQDKLKSNGWNGNLEDTNSLMKSMNKTLDEMGFTETAQGIYTLDDAYKALEVAGGRLLADVLIPLTPAITGAVDVIINGIDTAKNGINSLIDMWNGLPDWAQYIIGIGAFALAVGGAVAALGGLPGILLSIASIIGPVIALIGGISWPLVAIVAAIAAVGVAIYELGKYFGWWSDVSSMFDAICAGVQRIWSSIVNHPDVQATIQAFGAAWQWLSDALQPVIAWLGSIWDSIFPPGAKGNFDIVHTLIIALGKAWDILTVPIKNAITVFQLIYSAIMTVIGVLSPVINNIITIAQVIGAMFSGQISIIDGIMMIGYQIMDLYINVFSILANVVTDAMVFIAVAIGKGLMTAWNAFLSWLGYIATLPGRVFNFLVQVVNRIPSWAASMVSQATSAASRFVSSFVNGLASLPAKVTSGLGHVLDAVGRWGSQLINNVGQIVDDVKNKITSIPGQILSGADYEGFNIDSNVSYTGFNSGDYQGFDKGNSLNNTLANNTTTNNSSNVTINNNLNGIIEEKAGDYVVRKVNENIAKQIVLRGV